MSDAQILEITRESFFSFSDAKRLVKELPTEKQNAETLSKLLKSLPITHNAIDNVIEIIKWQ